jgi:hypothetical protein
MRRRLLIAGLVLAVLLLAGLGASISLARSVGSLVRARPRRARARRSSSGSGPGKRFGYRARIARAATVTRPHAHPERTYDRGRPSRPRAQKSRR